METDFITLKLSNFQFNYIVAASGSVEDWSFMVEEEIICLHTNSII